MAGTCMMSSLGTWGGVIGAFPSQWTRDEVEYLELALSTLPPVFVENEDKGFGLCVVCGKKGVLGRCLQCGSLMHFTCVVPESPGADQKCPVCYREVEDDGEAYPHLLDLGAPRARRAAARAGAAPVSEEAPKDASPPMLSVEPLSAQLVFPVGRSPTDEEARVLGFPSAKEWYVQASSAFRHGQALARPALEAEYGAVTAAAGPQEEAAEEGQDTHAEDQGALESNEVDDIFPLSSSRVGGTPASLRKAGTPGMILNTPEMFPLSREG